MAVKIIFRSQELSAPSQFSLLSPYDPVLEMSLDRRMLLSLQPETSPDEIAGRVVNALRDDGKAVLDPSGTLTHFERI
ncbi:MAG: hypothetical protein ACO3XO_06395 [Bdellovibrionota bacterium]|jgi:hypothetical protein